MICQHLGREIGRSCTPNGAIAEFACGHHAHQSTTRAACLTCPDFYAGPPPASARPSRAKKSPAPDSKSRHPAGVCVNRFLEPLNLGDLFLGASAFAVLGGPSTRSQPLLELSRRGCLIFSTNNCPASLPAGVRPHVWIHTDPTHKFHDALWRDPAILKFTPVREWTGRCGEPRPKFEQDARRKPKGLRRRAADGLLEFIPHAMAMDMPGIVGYHRNTAFNPDQWLFEPTINRGNDQDHAEGNEKKGIPANGYPRTINTMFSLLRLAFYLGVTRLYLLGADFRMDPQAPYGFDQGKHFGGCGSNNNAYANMGIMLEALRPHFLAHGFDVINCTPGSGLTVFPSMDFSEALEHAAGSFEQTLDARGWYDELKSSE